MIHVFRPIPVERLKLLVFDLDGTLIDSAQDLCNSVNASLAHVGRTPLPDPAIAGFVGNGAPMLVRRALAAADRIHIDQVNHDLQALTYAFFLDYYRAHKLDFTYAYEGVLDSLHALRELHNADANSLCPIHSQPGVPADRSSSVGWQSEWVGDQKAFTSPARVMAVLTNKPVRPARGICEGLGLASYFLHIYGGDSFPLKKPDPLGLRTLMNDVGASPDETAMIGDSQVDIQTARNAGVWSIGCTFGFGNDTLTAAPPESQPDILVDSPLDLDTRTLAYHPFSGPAQTETRCHFHEALCPIHRGIIATIGREPPNTSFEGFPCSQRGYRGMSRSKDPCAGNRRRWQVPGEDSMLLKQLSK